MLSACQICPVFSESQMYIATAVLYRKVMVRAIIILLCKNQTSSDIVSVHCGGFGFGLVPDEHLPIWKTDSASPEVRVVPVNSLAGKNK